MILRLGLLTGNSYDETLTRRSTGRRVTWLLFPGTPVAAGYL